MQIQAEVSIFQTIGLQIVKRAECRSHREIRKLFSTFFGISLNCCAILWNAIRVSAPKNGQRKHLLWALLFLRCYLTEKINCVLANTCDKTFRFWCWKFVKLIRDMKLIRLEKCREKRVFLNCLISVDGTDCIIREPFPFSSNWYSHKHNGPGLRYEVAVSVQAGEIVWVSGPYLCGSYSDVKIFRHGLKKHIYRNEKVVGDGGYNDEKILKGKDLKGSFKRVHSLIRARHEVLNGRIKRFRVLSDRFRHALSHHGNCFHAVANLVQLEIVHEHPLFEVEY